MMRTISLVNFLDALIEGRTTGLTDYLSKTPTEPVRTTTEPVRHLRLLRPPSEPVAVPDTIHAE